MSTNRLLRLKDAPGYVGMDVRQFNERLRPRLTEIPIGKRGIAFDRLELDAWVDHHKKVNGRPPRVAAPWLDTDEPKQTATSAFEKALEELRQRPKRPR